ncbi:MAG: hypothetical protein KF723_12185 [Rhizobiaceae bacterium]|nr:hypothetical protein [Rhizobiaceae bacterium]
MRRLGGVLVLALASSMLAGAANAVPGLMEPDPAVQKRLDEALERQDQMIAEAVTKLQPERPGVRDVFFVGVAGWGDQDVFRLEVRAVRKLFETGFGAGGRAVSLVNHRETLTQVPLATIDTIEATVMAVANRMNLEEDVLVLFMTSHGAEWEGFSLVLNGNDFGAVRTAQLARILGASRIRNRIVFVSSCFSGQFVASLAEENTLLITSAASDRASFGCSTDAEWTWFGEAFFRDALPKHRTFAKAFEVAAQKVAAREQAENYTPSVPQIRIGENIRAVLGELGF